MLDNIFNWLEEEKIQIEQEDEIYFINLADENRLFLEKNRFKIFKINNIWKWYFNKKKVIPYSEESFEKLKNFLEEIKEDEGSYNYTENNVYVREITTQTGFSSLISQLDKNYFVIPESQRNYVWTKEKVENLAVSLVRGLPIPPIYTYRNKKNQLVILDGQQRLTSLYLYSAGVYLKNKKDDKTIDLKEVLSEKIEVTNSSTEEKFLKKLEEKFKIEKVDYKLRIIGGETQDISYKNLNPNIRAFVDMRPLTIIEIFVQGTDNPEEVYYNIFGNLNQGGIPLTNQELRNGIYKSKFYDMLHEINNDLDSSWRKLYGAKHNRSKDTELLLRYIASEYMFQFKDKEFILERYIKDGQRIEEFKSSYPKLLNDFSKIAINFDEDEVEKYKNKLLNFFKRVNYPLDISDSKNKRVYNSLLESIYITDSKIGRDYKITEELIEKIRDDKIYKDTIHAGSSAKKKVEKRLNRVYKIILEHLGEDYEL